MAHKIVFNGDGILISETESPTYPPRTYHNAKTADLTVALAENFDSAGEKLTKKAASDNYVGIPLNLPFIDAARILYSELKKRNAKILNVAGNGLYSLSTHGWTQEKINSHVFNVISKVHEHWPLTKIISGGQTGVDMAGIVAGHALQIPVEAMLPKGCLQRTLTSYTLLQSGTDVAKQIKDGAEFVLSLKSIAHKSSKP
jgi:hypothetical protein